MKGKASQGVCCRVWVTAKAYSCSYGKDPTEKQKSLNSGERIVLEAVQQSEGQREPAPRGCRGAQMPQEGRKSV